MHSEPVPLLAEDGIARGSVPRTAAVAAVVAMFGTMTYSIPLPVLDAYARRLDESAAAAAWLQTAAAAPGAVLALGLAPLLSRFGVRATAAGCLVTYAVGGVGCALTDHLRLAIGCRALQGVGTVGLLVLGLIIVGNQLSGVRRDTVVSWVGAAMMSGGVIGPMLGSLAGAGDPRHAFLLYGAAILVLPLCLMIEPHRDQADPPGPVAAVRDGIAAARAQGSGRGFVQLVLLSATFLVLSNGVGQVVAPLFLADRLGTHNSATLGWLITLAGLSSTVTALLRPWLMRYVSSTALMWSGVAAQTLSIAALLANVFALTVVAEVLLGVSIGAFYPGLQIRLIALTNSSSRSALVSLWSEAVRIAQLAAPLLAGLVYGLLSPGESLVAYACGSLGVAAVVAVRRIPSRHSIRSQTELPCTSSP